MRGSIPCVQSPISLQEPGPGSVHHAEWIPDEGDADEWEASATEGWHVGSEEADATEGWHVGGEEAYTTEGWHLGVEEAEDRWEEHADNQPTKQADA